MPERMTWYAYKPKPVKAVRQASMLVDPQATGKLSVITERQEQEPILAESPASPIKTPLQVTSPTVIAFNKRLTVNPYAAAMTDQPTLKRKTTLLQSPETPKMVKQTSIVQQ